tara:strand:- start:24 stop:284 length:261 start_codon:yes stop_codon:yes gene_type:complete
MENTKDRTEYMKEYDKKRNCTDKRKEYQKEYQKKYREKKKEKIKKIKEDNINSDIKYYLENKDKIVKYSEKEYYLNLINSKNTTEI